VSLDNPPPTPAPTPSETATTILLDIHPSACLTCCAKMCWLVREGRGRGRASLDSSLGRACHSLSFLPASSPPSRPSGFLREGRLIVPSREGLACVGLEAWGRLVVVVVVVSGHAGLVWVGLAAKGLGGRGWGAAGGEGRGLLGLGGAAGPAGGRGPAGQGLECHGSQRLGWMIAMGMTYVDHDHDHDHGPMVMTRPFPPLTFGGRGDLGPGRLDLPLLPLGALGCLHCHRPLLLHARPLLGLGWHLPWPIRSHRLDCKWWH
jgi:hypothetical protein